MYVYFGIILLGGGWVQRASFREEVKASNQRISLPVYGISQIKVEGKVGTAGLLVGGLIDIFECRPNGGL